MNYSNDSLFTYSWLLIQKTILYLGEYFIIHYLKIEEYICLENYNLECLLLSPYYNKIISMYLLSCSNVQQMFPFGITAYILHSYHLIQTILQGTERFFPGTLLMAVTSQSKTAMLFLIDKYLEAGT